MKLNTQTNEYHIIFFGAFFLFTISFFSYFYTNALITDPENMIIHTRLIYYDGKYSETYKKEDLNTAAYVLNKSSQNIFMTIFEKNPAGGEKKYDMIIAPWQNQFLKTDGPGVALFTNFDHTSTSTIIFTKNPGFLKYYPAWLKK